MVDNADSDDENGNGIDGGYDNNDYDDDGDDNRMLALRPGSASCDDGYNEDSDTDNSEDIDADDDDGYDNDGCDDDVGNEHDDGIGAMMMTTMMATVTI